MCSLGELHLDTNLLMGACVTLQLAKKLVDQWQDIFWLHISNGVGASFFVYLDPLHTIVFSSSGLLSTMQNTFQFANFTFGMDCALY